ncbi:HNH endonuclease [Nocardia huaxiensis]|uniref:HNH endonuclease n=1 Tax=Nocardia huaxiensis TaxID=2755382 RepID=A0A7D6ZHD9_9NOCA|nr:HNH endonuclease family protein [Nocardia huaxiensis]QLY28023.1 HNH endonuclease [Nocardia huaxiensis]
MLQKKQSRTRKLVAALVSILVAVAVAVVVAYLEKGSDTGQGAPTAPDRVPVSSKDVTDMLAKLAVAQEAPMTGYSREKFPHWDTNKAEHGFGDQFTQYAKCTTREVMMLRDATGAVTLDAKTCELKVGSGGGWRDQYGVLDKKTGKLKEYKFITDPSGVDAEHIVPLAEAWRSGADKKDEATRRGIANDAINLVASDPTANRSKGDQDAANYLPPGKFRCAYVYRYINIKLKYGLTVDSAEQAALRTAVDTCVREGGFG